MDAGLEPILALDCKHNLGESIIWDPQSERLWWANIHAGEVWSWTPFSSEHPKSWSVSHRVGAIGLRRGDGLVVALEDAFSTFDPSSGQLGDRIEVEADLPTTRLNDGRVDPAGRFICGGMDEASPQQPISAMYSFDARGQVTKIIGNISCANSICWSPEGTTLYFTDMPSRRIDAFDYDLNSGAISNRRIFVDLAGEQGLADGSCVDAEGFLWNAQWGGHKVVRYRPDGVIDREIPLPVANPTCLCFGGRGLDTLFITSAWFGLSEEDHKNQPHAGGIFALKPGVKGQLEYRFAA